MEKHQISMVKLFIYTENFYIFYENECICMENNLYM